MPTLYIIIGLIIIVALSSYATILLLRVRKQNQQQQILRQQAKENAAQKAQQLEQDIRYIAQAMLDDRCEISEGTMRIGKLFQLLSLSDAVADTYPNLFKHFNVIEHHPIREQRNNLAKQQRMRFDLERMRSEAELEVAILDEAKQLAHFSKQQFH